MLKVFNSSVEIHFIKDKAQGKIYFITGINFP